MNRAVALAAVAAGAVIGYMVYREVERRERMRGGAKGSLGIVVRAEEIEVSGYIEARVEKGTPPVHVHIDGEAVDEDTGRRVWMDSKDCDNLRPGEKCVLNFVFYGEEGHTYQIRAKAVFKNRYGKDEESASKEVGPLGIKPKGSLKIVVTKPSGSGEASPYPRGAPPVPRRPGRVL